MLLHATSKTDELTDRLTERLSHERTSGVLIIDPAVFKCFRKMQKSDYQLRHVRLSVRMEQLGSHWPDFHEI